MESLEEVNGRLEKKLIHANEVANEYEQNGQDKKDGLDGLYFENDSNNSDSTDPFKIEPSLNIVFTAEEMRPPV